MNYVKYNMFFNKRKFDFESRHPDSEPACACFRKKRGMDNSERFRACFSDNMNRLLSFVYLPQIHFRIDLDGRLDETRLLDALQLAVRATPVLSCHYVEHPIRPYWEQNPKADCRSGDVFCVCQVDEACFQGVLHDFLSTRISERLGPQFKVMVLRTASTDSLILKLNHQAADACAVKEFGYLLAFLYDRLKTRPQFQPQVDCRSRSLRQVFGPFSAGRLLRLAARHMAETLNNFHPSKNLYFPLSGSFEGAFRWVFKRFDPGRVRALKVFCSQPRATVNDVVTTALVRAWSELGTWPENGVLRLVGTVDLCRHLPDSCSAGLCNLSSFYFLNLGKDPGDDFCQTLDRVKTRIDILKSKGIGLEFILGNWLLAGRLPFALQKFWVRNVMGKLMRIGPAPPVMTNMGGIDERRLDFGNPGVAAAELIAPPCYPPFFGVGLSGFRNGLSLTAEGSAASDFADRTQALFDRVARELLLEIPKVR